MNTERILEEIEVAAEPFALCELQGKCDLGVGRLAGATLHYVLLGLGTINFRRRPSVAVRPGSLVLIPAFESHTLHSDGVLGTDIPQCQPAELGLEHIVATAPGPDAGRKLVALCSRIHVGLRGSSGLIDLIREPLVTQTDGNDKMKAPLERLVSELSAPQFGGRAMIRTLVLECMIELLRQRLAQGDPALCWMRGLSDEALWNVLQIMLDRPGDAHSVESLADVAGMSRSTFTKHFSRSYGAGPMELLRELRMTKAATLLADSALPVKRIAAMVGFQSRSAFNRAFTLSQGKTPRQLRKEMHS